MAKNVDVILFVAGIVSMYFLPTSIAILWDKKNTGAIFALNLFMGWTFVGWVGALVWSLATPRR